MHRKTEASSKAGGMDAAGFILVAEIITGGGSYSTKTTQHQSISINKSIFVDFIPHLPAAQHYSESFLS